VDYAVVQAWPMEDQIRAAHYFKKKELKDEPISLQELDRQMAELPPDERATVELMLPTDQKGYLAVRARMKAKKTAARPPARRKRPGVKPAASSDTNKPEVEAKARGVTGAAVAGVIALIVVVGILVVVFRPRKKPSPDPAE
jgi:hypothetical protein